MTEPKAPKPTIMVASTVYSNQDLLDQIFSTLTGLGYSVWMSCKGTVPLDPGLDNFQNCIRAVEKCDLFLGIISGSYGSGFDGDGDSITHKEIEESIRKDKKRWFVVHQDVLTARRMIRVIARCERAYDEDIQSYLEFKANDPISDLRVLKMYHYAAMMHKPLRERTGNWVHPYTSANEVLRFVATQFGDVSTHAPVRA